MKERVFLLGTLLVSVLFYGGALWADAQTEDEKEIRALVQRLVTAARAKDVSDIMSSVYVVTTNLFECFSAPYKLGLAVSLDK